jgi:hypothetical protein
LTVPELQSWVKANAVHVLIAKPRKQGHLNFIMGTLLILRPDYINIIINAGKMSKTQAENIISQRTATGKRGAKAK